MSVAPVNSQNRNSASGQAPTSRPAPAAAATEPASSQYTVKRGDSMWAISRAHGVGLDDLIKANPQVRDPNLIYPGQQLSIPGAAAQGASHATRGKSDTPPPTAIQNGALGVDTLRAQLDSKLDNGGARYTVQPGDTLSGIGARFGVPWQDIASANRIANPNRIYPGTQLTIPGSDPQQVSQPTPIGPVPGPSSGGVSADQLRAIMPNLSAARAEQLLPHLNSAMAEAGIDTPLRQAAFLAQLGHESVGLTAFEEFASGDAYEGRSDLGNTEPGDGRRYKGRGPIQLTGRANYRAAGAALGIDLENNPQRAADPDVGFRVAAWYWNNRNLNSYADARDFDAITYRVNGGYNGKASRDAYYARALEVLGA